MTGSASSAHRFGGTHTRSAYRKQATNGVGSAARDWCAPTDGTRRSTPTSLGHRSSSRNVDSRESSSGRTSARRTPVRRATPASALASSAARDRRHHDAVAVDRHAADAVEPDEGGGEAPGVVGAHEHLARAVGHGRADGAVVAGGGQPAPHEHDLAAGEALDLVEHVGADDDRPALVAEAVEQLDEGDPLHGVGAVERLVEHEHRRVRDEGGGDARALAHALAEAADPPVGDVEQVDGGEGGVGGGAVADAVQRRRVADELAGGERRRGWRPPRARGRPSAAPRGRRAGRARRPAPCRGSAPSRPQIARMSVVLPAPFGPSRPVTPGPNEHDTSVSATFWPNHTDTPADLDGRRRRRTRGRRRRRGAHTSTSR